MPPCRYLVGIIAVNAKFRGKNDEWCQTAKRKLSNSCYGISELKWGDFFQAFITLWLKVYTDGSEKLTNVNNWNNNQRIQHKLICELNKNWF